MLELVGKNILLPLVVRKGFQILDTLHYTNKTSGKLIFYSKTWTLLHDCRWIWLEDPFSSNLQEINKKCEEKLEQLF